MTPLERRLQELSEKLDRQAGEFANLQKSEGPTTDQNLRILQKELSDLKKASQATPRFQSRAQPVIVADMSKSGLPSDVERAIASRLAGFSSSDDLYKALGLIRKPYGA
jgi:hypothetical protein